MLKPSSELVPLPTSSKITKEFSVEFLRILETSFISNINVDSPLEILSLAPILVNT